VEKSQEKAFYIFQDSSEKRGAFSLDVYVDGFEEKQIDLKLSDYEKDSGQEHYE
jgi:hypothetical protein